MRVYCFVKFLIKMYSSEPVKSVPCPKTCSHCTRVSFINLTEFHGYVMLLQEEHSFWVTSFLMFTCTTLYKMCYASDKKYVKLWRIVVFIKNNLRSKVWLREFILPTFIMIGTDSDFTSLHQNILHILQKM